jgi:hypothetical protein
MTVKLPVARHAGDIRDFRHGHATVMGFASSVASARRVILSGLPDDALSLIKRFGFKLSVELVSADGICNISGEAYYRYSIGKQAGPNF